MANPGSFGIWIADATGAAVDYRDSGDPQHPAQPNPKDDRAIDIYFGPRAGVQAPKEQIELQVDIDKLLTVLRRLYLDAATPQPAKFRSYYVRAFQLAQLGLEGEDVSTDLARTALAALTVELIDDEAVHVKNGHLSQLGSAALTYGLALLTVYALLRLLSESVKHLLEDSLGVDPRLAANFMLLWVGCFLGVWLSYGIRTATFTLADLTRTDSDRLLPHMRLLFAGSLTMLLGMMFVLEVIELKIGNVAVTDFETKPMFALLIGAFCGLSEATLPTSIARKATSFVAEIK